MILSNVRTDFNFTIERSNQGYWVFFGLCIIDNVRIIRQRSCQAERPLVFQMEWESSATVLANKWDLMRPHEMEYYEKGAQCLPQKGGCLNMKKTCIH